MSPAYAGTIHVKTPQPTAIIATFVSASRTNGRSRTTDREPPATRAGRSSSRTATARIATSRR
jgi:hypothetical protein